MSHQTKLRFNPIEVNVHRRISNNTQKEKEITLGKVLGFLGITADVTGFSFDPPVLVASVVLASILQILKNSAEDSKLAQKNSKHPK